MNTATLTGGRVWLCATALAIAVPSLPQAANPHRFPGPHVLPWRDPTRRGRFAAGLAGLGCKICPTRKKKLRHRSTSGEMVDHPNRQPSLFSLLR